MARSMKYCYRKDILEKIDGVKKRWFAGQPYVDSNIEFYQIWSMKAGDEIYYLYAAYMYNFIFLLY